MCNIILFLTEGNAFQLGKIDKFSLPPNFEFYSLLCEISLVVQWLRLHTPNAGGRGSIPGQGTKILHAT